LISERPITDNQTDKVPETEKEFAKELFQKLSFAYGILSDPRRRSRYDITGRTNETLHLDDEDDFNWSDYFKTQFEDVITADAISQFKAEYQGSEEEKLDVIAAYVNYEGDMDGLFEEVMLSNPLDDEDRFRAMIDEEIDAKRVEAFETYTKETKSKRKKRIAEAKKEEKEAMEEAEKLGVADKLFANNKGTNGKKSKTGEADISGLELLIKGRQKDRATNFFADLEAKYAQGNGKKKSGKRVADDSEPSEEAFEKAAQRMKKARARKTNEDVADTEQGEVVEGRRPKRVKR
jgi:DnaJ family protein C protein 9